MTERRVQSQTSFGDRSGRARRSRPRSPQPVTLTAAQINALIGAAADPEPMVRARAVKALAASGERDRVVTPLVARLVDQARVVRAHAAQALLALGVAQLPGEAGEAALARAGRVRASLETFPTCRQSCRARLARGRAQPLAQAHAALDTAISWTRVRRARG